MSGNKRMSSPKSNTGLNSTVYSNILEEYNLQSKISNIINRSIASTPKTNKNQSFNLNNSKVGKKKASFNSAIQRIASSLTRLEASRSLNEIEAAILRSKEPLDIEASEEIEVNGHSGILLNKCELDNWKGPMPLNHYPINQDDQPKIITKRSSQHIEYIKELAIRYLRPPTPQEPGEIIIKQLPNRLTAPAPPLILRQQPARAETPEPLVIREAPPAPPPKITKKIITISGKQLPPPPRKVVIERLAPLPTKPQSVIIERWLPYEQSKRKVILKRPSQPDPVVESPKNVIVQWEAPKVHIKQEFKHLGVVRADPIDYVQRYGNSLLDAKNLPDFVTSIKAPDGLILAAEKKCQCQMPTLEGDLEALGLIDLDKEGLGEYKSFASKFSKNENSLLNSSAGWIHPCSGIFIHNNLDLPDSYEMNRTDSDMENLSKISFENGLFELRNLVEQIFRSIDKNNTGSITKKQGQNIILKLNSKLNRKYRREDIISFFNQLDMNQDDLIDLHEFNTAFLNLAASTLINSIE